MQIYWILAFLSLEHVASLDIIKIYLKNFWKKTAYVESKCFILVTVKFCIWNAEP